MVVYTDRRNGSLRDWSRGAGGWRARALHEKRRSVTHTLRRANFNQPGNRLLGHGGSQASRAADRTWGRSRPRRQQGDPRHAGQGRRRSTPLRRGSAAAGKMSSMRGSGKLASGNQRVGPDEAYQIQIRNNEATPKAAPRCHIIEDDAPACRQAFKLTGAERLCDIEKAKSYKRTEGATGLPRSAIDCPATSSMTTKPGSWRPLSRADGGGGNAKRHRQRDAS